MPRSLLFRRRRGAAEFATVDKITPANSATLSLWLDASHAPSVLNASGSPVKDDAEIVATWNDRSSQGLSFSATGNPVWRRDRFGVGRHAINFDSALLQYFGITNTITTATAGHVFIVARPTNATSSSKCLLSFANGGANTTDFDFFTAGGGVSFDWLRILAQNAGDTTTDIRFPAKHVIPNGLYVFHIWSDDTSVFMEVSNVVLGVTLQAGAYRWIGDIAGRTRTFVGAQAQSTIASYFDGDIAEIRVYSGVLSDSDAAACMDDLRWKWSDGGCRMFAGCGDSLMDLNSYIEKVAADITASKRGLTVSDHAAGGATVATVGSQWFNAKASGYAGAIIQGGINNIVAGTSAAAMFTVLRDTVESVRSYGIPCVLLNVTGFGNNSNWTADRQSNLENYNALLKTLTADPNVHLVDLYTGMGTAGNLKVLNATYDNGDGLHYNDAGNQRVGDLVRPVLESI